MIMDDLLAFIIKLICIVGEVFLNLFTGSLRELIRYPGMLLYKIIWPPNWFGKMEDNGVSFYVFGVLFYIFSGLFMGLYCCNSD